MVISIKLNLVVPLIIPGTKRIDRLWQNLGGAAVTFTPDELAEINRTLDSITIPRARCLSIAKGMQERIVDAGFTVRD
ncbi:hypothetical protein [Bifidobacterium goeldii]|uniref:hypothetical protein n=1 Tax=Bifidobacterium goeldii TaxID=2306975 RepID=UPI000F7DB702|nr:hypothetical protein [Bifidobacterium goeldii]